MVETSQGRLRVPFVYECKQSDCDHATNNLETATSHLRGHETGWPTGTQWGELVTVIFIPMTVAQTHRRLLTEAGNDEGLLRAEAIRWGAVLNDWRGVRGS